MPKNKKSNPAKTPQAKNGAFNTAFPYPAKIRCSVVTQSDAKKPQVRFVTENEVGATQGIPTTFKGEGGETTLVATGLVAGLGSLVKLDSDIFGDHVAATLAKTATRFEEYQIIFSRQIIEKVGLRSALRLAVVAEANAEYPTDFLKSSDNRTKIKVKKTEIVVPDTLAKVAEEIINAARIEARHIAAMRQVQALPGNYLTPQTMDERTAAVAREFKIARKVFGLKELTQMGAGGILAVSQGSAREPKLIVLESKHAQAKKTLTFVGKGVTFDTGGISLKPGADMHEMKFDMSGSAMALSAFAAIVELKLPINAVCAVAMVENMPSGTAFKPGDVYSALGGKTVEVQNTDAEGRLILSDTLTYVQNNYRSDLVIDMATLTGACVVALGDFYAGLFTNNPGARALLEKAAHESQEPVWALPVGRRYRELLKSDIADINNIGGRYGGASTAAEFLHSFIDDGQMWAHLDIAGVGMIKKPFSVYTASGSGYGVRLLCEVARQLSAST